MEKNAIFNVTVCILGVLILVVHIANLLAKKGMRKDEKSLLVFFIFTAVHFATYLCFTLIKMVYTSNAYIIAFYTVFYLMNNLEVYLLYKYMCNYVELPTKTGKTLSVVNLVGFSVMVLLVILNVFTGVFFTAENGVYVRANTMIISQTYQFVMFAAVFIVTFINSKLNKREKTAFALYCFLPLIAIILQNVFKGYAIAYASIIIAVEILFVFLSAEKNIKLAKEIEKNKEAQIKIMLSQIKPHFIYNSLSSISTLITIDPEKAQAALDNFTEYLRHNLSSLSETRLIPFEYELKHIKTYISLEKMRFNDRVTVNYDIKTEDFNVPPLSIQPIVENAIKHGILKKIEGGTLTVKTIETADNYVVEIIDDGVGFNMQDVDFEDNIHVGINNVKFRIRNCGGDVAVKSEVGKGTSVTVTFKKEVIR